MPTGSDEYGHGDVTMVGSGAPPLPKEVEARMIARWAVPFLVPLMLAANGHAQQQRRPTTDQPLDSEQDNTLAQPPEQEPGQSVPFFRSGINFIRVDVIVTDSDGNMVTDLTADDFELYEDGSLQTVESFQLVEIGSIPAPGAKPARQIFNEFDQEREAARADVRVFVIFFDDYHVRRGSGVRAGEMLAEFLETSLIPTDLVGIMYPLTPLDSVRLTRNHDAVVKEVKNFLGVKYNYEIRNGFEARYNDYPTVVVERIRNDVSLSALRGLMIHLGGLREGRKHVLLVSEGYTYYVPHQLRSMNAMLPPSTPQRPDPFTGSSNSEETIAFFENSTLMMDLRRLFSTANRFNTAIYTVDPRGLAPFEFDLDQPVVGMRTDRQALRNTQDTLYVLAEETDGRAIINQNDLVPGLRQMLRDASTYYLLGYNSSEAATDGQYHEIAVRVKREGVRVRARKGYWAVTERDAKRALAPPVNEPPKAVDVALSALAEPRQGRLVRTWVGTSRGESGKTRVTFVWEPTTTRGRREVPSRVLVTAMGNQGGAYYRGRVPEGVARQASGPGAGSPPATHVEFEADPGTMLLSLAIEDESGEVLDRDRDEIKIPDFTGPDIVLSTPSFVRAANASEWKALVENRAATPTATREFRRTDRLLIRFEAYTPGTTIPVIRARLLNRSGDSMYPLVLLPSEDCHWYQVDVRPANLPPGEYIIELTATTPGGDATELVAFRLTS